jgi:glycosyltransferase involved in cell wall biosynthesis
VTAAPFDVSVVIPTYNRARWLPSAVQSVLSQTHPPAEVVIVDDGSKDETPQVCAAFPAPVRCVRQENAGAALARNRGIREASREWVAFQDSDDLWTPDKLEVQREALRLRPEAGWCITGFSIIDEAGQPRGEGPAFEDHFPVFREEGSSVEAFFGRFFDSGTVVAAGRSHRIFWGDAFPALFLGNFAFPQGTVVRRDLLQRLGGFDPAYRFAEDTNLFHRLAAEAPLVVVMTPLFRYRVGSYDSIIKPGNTVPLIEFSLKSLDECLARVGRAPEAVLRSHRRGRERLLLRLAYSHLSNHEPAAARRALRTTWSEGGGRSLRAASIFTASCLPAAALRAAHRVKRSLRRVLPL